MKWEKVKLKDIATIKKGSYITKNEANEGIYPVILGGRTPAYYIDRFNHTGKAIVVSRSGASAGYVSFWNEPIFVTDGFLVEPHNNISYEYLYYLLKNCQIELLDKQRGAAIPHVTPALLYDTNIMLPSTNERQKIAYILSTYDDLIENNRKQIKLLEEAAQRLYKEWFVDLRFPGWENAKIVDGVPEGWEKYALSEIAPILTGKKDANYGTEDGQYPFFTCAQEPIKAPNYSFDTGAVILAGNGDFNVKLYRGKFEAYQRTYVLSPQNEAHLYLLYNAVKMSMQELFAGAAGSTIKFLTKGMIERIPVIVPSQKVLERYNSFSESTQCQIENCIQKIQLATEARDRLLPKLMSGELEV